MIKKIFLGLFLLLTLAGGYFYFFPIYPDYDISEEYFYSKYYDKSFSSEDNGFHEIKKLLTFLNEQEDILKLDTFAKCVPTPNKNDEYPYIWSEGYIDWSYWCVEREPTIESVLSEYTRDEVIAFTSYLSGISHAKKVGNNDMIQEYENLFSGEKKQRLLDYESALQKQESLKESLTKKYHKNILSNKGFQDSLKQYFQYLENIAQKPYISSLNLDVGVFDEPEVLYTPIIQYQRILRYYVMSELEYGSQDIAIETYTRNYKSLIHIYNDMDGKLIESLIFLTSIGIQQDLGRYMIHTYNISEKNKELLKEVYSQEIFGRESIQNSIKRDYLYGEQVLFEEVFSKEKLGFSPKTILFFSENDTRNLMKYQSKQLINNKPVFDVRLNGRNWIGRTLATGWVNNYSSQFSKAESLETKRNILLDLLSN